MTETYEGWCGFGNIKSAQEINREIEELGY